MQAFRPIYILTSFAVLTAGAFAADEKTAPTLPPLGVWQSPTDGKDVTFDLKNDKTISATEDKTGRPPIKKDDRVPFIGFSLTKPIGN